MNTWPEGVGIIPNKTRVIIIYPTVDPQVVIVPILSSIIIFPVLVFIIICCLRKMAARRRQMARLAQREEAWNERSCASIVQRSPPLSFSGTDKFGEGDGTTTVELMTPEGDLDIIDDEQIKKSLLDAMKKEENAVEICSHI